MDSLSAVQSVSSMSESMKTSLIEYSSPAAQTQPSFVSMLGEGINNVNNNILTAESTMNTFSLDGNTPTHELMLTMEKAKFSLQVAVEVRNRLVEAYSELTRMQI